MENEIKPKRMHVDFPDLDEYKRVEAMRGKRKWREWLVSLPDQFRELTERVEHYKREATFYKEQLEQAEERIKVLQEQVKDV